MQANAQRRPFWRSHWPLWVGGLLWLALFAVELGQVLSFSDGRLAYASDDVYIHMAIARNLVVHGIWGVAPGEFASCASSIGWPLLIAGIYRIFGINDWAPLALNVFFSLATLVVVHRGLRRRRRGDVFCLVFLLAVVLFLPFTALVFNGMEHVLQVFLFLAFAERLLTVLEKGSAGPPDGWLLALAAGLTIARYEGLFLAGAAAILLAGRRQWRTAAAVAVAALLPVAAMAGVSLAQGWYPLPNSVLIKSAPFTDLHPETPAMNLTRPIRFLSGRDYVLSIIVLLLAAWIAGARKSLAVSFLRLAPGLFFLMVAFVHGAVINIEWFYRHAAYLIALGLWALESTMPPGRLSLSLPRGAPVRAAVAALGVLLAYPFLWRAAGAILHTPPAARNIYEMQYQMAQFLRRYYPEGPVAVNDIGAVSFYNDFPILDLYGLASMDVARAKLSGMYNSRMMNALVRETGARVVVVYDYWFTQFGGIPPEWVKAGEWRFQDCYVCGGDTVSFYAPDPREAAALERNLVAYRAVLPVRVTVELSGGR
jgi:hypothetical protein